MLDRTAVMLACLGSFATAQPPMLHRETGGEVPGSIPAHCPVETRVIATSPEVTVLEISVGTEAAQLSDSTTISAGLVAIPRTGSVVVRLEHAEGSILSRPGVITTLGRGEIPPDAVTVSRPSIWRDVRLVQVEVRPRWKDQPGFDRVLRHAVVRIVPEAGHGINEKTRPIGPVSPTWDHLYRQHLLNYDWLDLPRFERGTGNRYIVVSRTVFDTQTSEFVEWKSRQGYGVDLVTLEELGFTNPSTGEAISAVKDYILNAYNTWPEPPEFVLLLGDIDSSNPAGSIWTEQFYNPLYGQGWRFHDQWYGFLEGDDVFADIMVGRFPDVNPSRLGYQLQKSCEYENAPYFEGTWQKNALMTLKCESTDYTIIATKELVSDLCGTWGMNVIQRFQNQAYPASIIPVVNQGVSLYNYRGDNCGSTSYNGTFGSSDVQYLTNTRKLGVWTILSCSSAHFDNNTTTAELLLQHGFSTPGNPRGAVGFIGSQAYTYFIYNNPLDEGLYRSLTEGDQTLLGAALLWGKAWAWNHMYAGFDPAGREAMMREYTVLGDPSLQIWTDVPRQMLVGVDPQYVLSDSTTSVMVSVGESLASPIGGALVCIANGTDVYAYGYTRGTGSVVLPVTPTSPGTLALTVTAPNMVPFMGAVYAMDGIPPRSPEGLTAQVVGADLLLTWDPVIDDLNGDPLPVAHYDVFRATVPYAPAQGLPLASPETASFLDEDVVGDAGVDFFYRVVAVAGDGTPSAPTDPTGVMDLELVTPSRE